MICDHFSYSHGIRHGVTTYLLETLPLLNANGVNLHLCFLRPRDPLAPKIEDLGIKTTFLNLARWDIRAFRGVEKVAIEHKAHLLHAIGQKASFIARWLAPRIDGVPLLHFHDQDRLCMPLRMAHKRYDKVPTYGIAVSQSVARIAQHEYNIPQDRMEVIRNGINLSLYHRPPHNRSEMRRFIIRDRPAAQTLGILGRMHPVKGHAEIIGMLGAILREKPRTVLVVIGDGPDRVACKKLAQDLGVAEHVVFMGHRNDIPAILHCLDIVLVPSRSEGLPFSVIEAQASGCPVVGYDVGGMSEILGKGIGGILVPPGDSGAFVTAVLQLLDNRKLRQQLGKSGQQNAAHFNTSSHVQKLLTLYRRTIDSSLYASHFAFRSQDALPPKGRFLNEGRQQKKQS
jgi:glycosyltransferase involved in cell wall biosynthesis